MDVNTEELENKLFSLPSKRRAELAERLIESLDASTIDQLWLQEAKRRRDDIRKGTTSPIPYRANFR